MELLHWRTTMSDMTLDKIRDAIARLLGWHFVESNRHFASSWTKGNGESRRFDHPVPASLDWVSENWPKDHGMDIRFQPDIGWIAYAWTSTGSPLVADQYPTELHARLALLLAVLEADGNTP